MGHPEWLDEDDKAEAWKPEEGDVLIGRVTSRGEWDAGYGTYPIVTVLPDDGEPLAFHAFHKVAQAKLDELGIEPGDHIGIRYVGEVSGKNGNTYHNYVIKRVPDSVIAPPAKLVPFDDYGEEPF